MTAPGHGSGVPQEVDLPWRPLRGRVEEGRTEVKREQPIAESLRIHPKWITVGDGRPGLFPTVHPHVCN